MSQIDVEIGFGLVVLWFLFCIFLFAKWIQYMEKKHGKKGE